MTRFAYLAGAAVASLLVTTPAFAKSSKASSGAQDQQRGTAEIPRLQRTRSAASRSSSPTTNGGAN